MRKNSKRTDPRNELTIDFGYAGPPREAPTGNPFQRVKSEMLKRRERLALRRKPMQYEKLENSLQEKLKQKSFDSEEQRDQLVMLEKCKNYFQERRGQSHLTSPKPSMHLSRPQTSTPQEGFLRQLRSVMQDCAQQHRQQQQVKENMHLFTFYCRMMDKRLEGIKTNIQKKERMI